MQQPQPRGYADIETGEVYDLVAVPRSQSRSFNAGGFFMGMLAAFGDLADAPDLTDGDRTVLLKLLSRLDWENYLHLNVSELSRDMGRARESVSRSVKHLEARGVIFRGPRVGRAYTYRLNPDLAWRGKPDARRRVQREIEKRGLKVVEGDNMPGEPEQTLPGL